MIAAILLACLFAADPLAPPTTAEIRAIDLSDADEDTGWVAPVARNLDHLATDPERRAAVDAFTAALPSPPEPLALTFALLNAAALADLGRSECEAEAAFTVFARLTADPRREAILRAAGTIALGRDGLPPETAIPALGIATTTPPAAVHERIELLARKLVGRLLGTLPR